MALVTPTPRWAWVLAGALVWVLLARHGRRPGKPVVTAAVVPSQFERLTPDIIVRALGSLGLAGIDKTLREGKEIAFVPVMHSGPGWRTALDLPYGTTATEVIERRDKLASGLRRPLGCVWPEGHEDHAGRLVLYVGDEPLRKMRQPAWPLASAGKFSLFDPVPYGTDQRGKPVVMPLMFANLLIGSIPRMGKTVALRNVLLAAALDPLAELHVWELKGTGDLEPLARVAHSYGSGADDDTIEAAVSYLRRVHGELGRRAKTIKDLPREQCPDSRVSPQLAARRSLRLHPLVYAIDECQEAFSHPEYGSEFGRLAEAVIRRGPAMGIILLLATQRPDAKSLPTGITANVAMRFVIKTMDQPTNDMLGGTSAYKRGINATLFTFGDKGIGWAVGFGDAHVVVKAYHIGGQAADRIALRARAARELAGTLSGHAAGLDGTEPARSVAADVLAVLDGADRLWRSTIATRLAERIPQAYADITPRARQVTSGGRARWSCRGTRATVTARSLPAPREQAPDAAVRGAQGCTSMSYKSRDSRPRSY